MSPKKTFKNKLSPHSRHGEDIIIFDFLSAGAIERMWSGGVYPVKTFIEMGAFDGVSDSNTLLFERCLNWTGVLIEANPQAFKALAGSGRNHSDLVHATTTCNNSVARQGTALMQTHPNTGATLSPLLSAPSSHSAEVPCVSLTAVLQHLKVSRVDFFSLDVESAESLVISTLNLHEIDVALLMAESSNRFCRLSSQPCPSRDAVRARMSAEGYAFNPVRIPASDVFTRPGVQLI